MLLRICCLQLEIQGSLCLLDTLGMEVVRVGALKSFLNPGVNQKGSVLLVGTEAFRLLGVLLPVNPLKLESPFYMMAKVENAAFA